MGVSGKELYRRRYADAAFQIHRLLQRRPPPAAAVAADEDPPPAPAAPGHNYDSSSKTSSKVRQTAALTTQPRTSGGGKAQWGRVDAMDLSYVTERIIALWVPGDVSVAAYRQGQQQAAHMLHTKHSDNYMVFNLSERRRAARSHHERVQELGWPPDLAPPLERLCKVCKDIDEWLSGDAHRIAVIHARGCKERIGVVVAAYMHYSSICGSADQALDRFAMARFLSDKIGDLQQPSHRRYVEYFSGLLSSNIRINAAPLYLTHVTVLGAPSFEPPADDGGCKAFLKVYEGLVPVYTSGVHAVSGGTRQFTVNVAAERHRRGLQLRGDILLRCYHRRYPRADARSPLHPAAPASPRPDGGRELVFACQFHTCAVADYTLSFTRQELDHACNDLRFPLDGAVELHFSPTPEVRLPCPAPTPAVPVTLADDPVTRWDSYENLGLLDSPDSEEDAADEVVHTFGPLDGSLYATVAKKQELQDREAARDPGGGAAVIGSPHTVSMDSGISSAGNNGLLLSSSQNQPPAAKNPGSSYEHHRAEKTLLSGLNEAPFSPEDSHRALDALLSDMLQTVQNIPDLPSPPGGGGSDLTPLHHRRRQPAVAAAAPAAPSHNGFGDHAELSFIDDESDIPYHARQDSRPFTYGALPSPQRGNMSGPLSSPGLVRRAAGSRDLGDDDVDGGLSLSLSPEPRDYRASNGSGSLSPRSPEFHDGHVVGGGSLTWLQRQQQKLRERKEVQMRTERLPSGARLISELRSVQHHGNHHHTQASRRADGYASDTSHLAGDDEDFTVPLHINTQPGLHKPVGVGSAPASPLLPTRSPSRRYYGNVQQSYQAMSNSAVTPLGRHKSDTYFDRERPFVAIKRVHEQNRKLLDSQDCLRATGAGVGAGPGGRTDAAYAPQSPGSPGAPLTSPQPGLLTVVEHEEARRRQEAVTLRRDPETREDSFSSWRTTSTSDEAGSPPRSTSPRPQTPAFPVHPRTPYVNSSSQQFDTSGSGLPPKSPTTQRKDRSPSPVSDVAQTSLQQNVSLVSSASVTSGHNVTGLPTTPHSSASLSDSLSQQSPKSPVIQNGSTGHSSPTVYYGHSRRSSLHSNSEPPQEVSPAHVKFVRDTSRFWYKPTISREEAIGMLRDRPPGTFVVRDSNSFPGAFGLALKVATPPPGVQGKLSSSGDPASELVRHFLIEPTSRGVRLKGCSNEPVFSSLSALVYQHSLMQMALPCRLLLPEGGGSGLTPDSPGTISTAQQLLAQGAACNVLYLFTMDTESLTGPQAIRKAVQQLFQLKPLPVATVVHFKVSGQGITLTDSKRKVFFRRHYPVATISHCGLDPEDRRWSQRSEETGLPVSSNRCFGFVARKLASKTDNQCHVFAELEPEQPASAIVNFVSKVMLSGGTLKANIV
ncbi:tensin-1 isoform X3 [Bacillus rossius redtenbacheri]|uniref:tensin-1 isoform X3 n=1 Tax=Bacillus rossius redtenbacheri TaxID=93214 RepID=UPI002FDE634B